MMHRALSDDAQLDRLDQIPKVLSTKPTTQVIPATAPLGISLRSEKHGEAWQSVAGVAKHALGPNVRAPICHEPTNII